MAKSLLLSVALLCLLTIVGSQANLSSGFGKVNKFLAAKERNTVDDYIAQVNSELSKIKLLRFSVRPSYEDALLHLRKLAKITPTSIKCNDEEFQLIDAAAASCDGHRFVADSSLATLTPVDLIVHNVSLTRARRCIKIWPQKFAEAHPEFKANKDKRIEFKRRSLARIRASKETDEDYLDYLINYQFFEDRTRIKDAYAHIVNQMEKEARKNGRARIGDYFEPEQLCDFDELYNDYLKIDCQIYINQIGTPFLAQYLLDARMFNGTEAHERDLKLIPFYESLVNYKACDQVRKQWFQYEVYAWWVSIQVREKTICFREFESSLKRKQVGRFDPDRALLWVMFIGSLACTPVLFPMGAVAILTGAALFSDF